MKTPKIKDKRIFILLFVIAVLGAFYLYRRFLPILTYDITLLENPDSVEAPLEITRIDKDIIFYTFSIKSQKDSIKLIELEVSKQFTNTFPFFDYGNNMTLILTIKEEPLPGVSEGLEPPAEDELDEKYKSFLYSINGTLSNLKIREYRLRIEDQHGNLIDEQTFELKDITVNNDQKSEENRQTGENGTGETTPSATNPPSLTPNPNTNPMLSCVTNEDCVAVGCGCSCSGCGGFSYEEIVNGKYEDLWYFEHDCKPSEICLQVCCPKREIACENNTCVVKELK